MKKTLVGALVIVLIMGSAFHFSIVYLNYIRTLGIGFAAGVNLPKPGNYNTADKGLFQVTQVMLSGE